MSKRQRSGDEGSTKRPHLYLVVDDWSGGYSIHKVDVADFDGEPGVDLDAQADCLSDPPVFRIERPHDRHPFPRFDSVGSKIVAMRYLREEEDTPVLLYDKATGGLTVGPRHPAELKSIYWLVPASDRLYVMGRTKVLHERQDHVEVLATEEKGRWVWNTVRMTPFDLHRVTCYAAHPDGRTVFFSAHDSGTYSFDTQTHEWKHHGDWMLPFKGCAYYDDEVDAWVGLKPKSSCDVVVPAGDDSGGGRPLAWKVAKEKMVCEDRDRTIHVALTPMAGGGKFCLVEHRSRKGVPTDILDTHDDI